MRRAVRGAAALAFTAAALLGLAALSAVPYSPPDAGEAVLRLSWRARGERVQECRRLSDAEKAKLPAHMRRDEVCEGRLLPSRLLVEVDGRVLVDDSVHASGARGDRPLYVFRELPLPPGTHEVRVGFEREDRGGDAATPARLELARTLDLAPGEVALVTYDADARALVVRLPDRGPPTASPRRR